MSKNSKPRKTDVEAKPATPTEMQANASSGGRVDDVFDLPIVDADVILTGAAADTLSARAETSVRRARMMIAGAFAFAAMLRPAGAWGLDGPSKQIPERANHLLPLPPIPYLDSMQWMSWKPSPPLFRMDTCCCQTAMNPMSFVFRPTSRGLHPK